MPDLNEKKSTEELMSKKQSVFANVLNLFSVKMMHDNIFQLRYQNEILLLNNDPQKQLLLVPSKNILLQFINDVNVELKPLGVNSIYRKCI